jgi:hypothetical protein
MHSFAPPREGIPASGARRCTLRPEMADPRSRWRWAFYVSVPFLMAGTIVSFTAEHRSTLQRVGMVVFVVSAAVYAAARIATTFGGRPK